MAPEEFRSEMPATEVRPGTALPKAENANAALVRRFLEAFEADDTVAVRGLLAESVVWHYGGTSVISGEHRGVDAVLNFFKRVHEETDGSLKIEVISLMTDSEYATLWNRATASRQGKTLDIKEAVIFQIRDGKIVEVWHRPQQPEDDAFFS